MTTTAPEEKPLQPQTERAIYRCDEVLFLVKCGEDPARAARRVGVGLSAIEKNLLQHGRLDDLEVIRAAMPLPLHCRPTRKAQI